MDERGVHFLIAERGMSKKVQVVEESLTQWEEPAIFPCPTDHVTSQKGGQACTQQQSDTHHTRSVINVALDELTRGYQTFCFEDHERTRDLSIGGGCVGRVQG